MTHQEKHLLPITRDMLNTKAMIYKHYKNVHV